VKALEEALAQAAEREAALLARLAATQVSPAPPPASAADAMRAYLLKNITFPSDSAAYEFEDFVLPEDNPFKESVAAAGVIKDWSSSTLAQIFF